MYTLFEESGKLASGRILSTAQASAQIELESGKRTKVKDSAVLIKFESPEPSLLLQSAEALAQEIDLQLAWEFAPEEEFHFLDLCVEYFSQSPQLVEQVAMLITLQVAPHYFRRAGKGRFKKATAQVLQQALLAIQRKKEVATQITSWAEELVHGRCPPAVLQDIYKILFKPDKNTPTYKAVVEAAKGSQTPPMELLLNAGAIASAYEFHWQRFLFEHFPKGTGFPASVPGPSLQELDKITQSLPRADVLAYSIDDSNTTEIDDALSLTGLGSSQVTLGIHIAAPSLWIKPNDVVDQVARERLSTVYMPGAKITMLPDSVIKHFTLSEGMDCPAVSLYVRFDAETLEMLGSSTKIELVHIQSNLRHDQLEQTVTKEWLTHDELAVKNLSDLSDLPRAELSCMYRIALHLKAAREVVRGKPENFNRPDYNFQIQSDQTNEDQPQSTTQSTTQSTSPSLTGSELVTLVPRLRGSPLDLIVAESMILANSTWGKWIAEYSVPAIYRSQASMAPGIKVKMSTKALPHAGIGVACYAWSTSPLRRYTDLVNQWQIIACAQHGATAALVAPFKTKDTDLMVVISSFDSAYTGYNTYQSNMERYWTLKYLEQNGIGQLKASVFKSFPGTPPLARAEELPLVISVSAAPELPRGAQILVRLGAINYMTLEVRADFIERLESVMGNAAGDAITADSEQNLTDDLDDLEELSAAPTLMPISIDLEDDDDKTHDKAEGSPGSE